jgi:hypothetical protein
VKRLLVVGVASLALLSYGLARMLDRIPWDGEW